MTTTLNATSTPLEPAHTAAQGARQALSHAQNHHLNEALNEGPYPRSGRVLGRPELQEAETGQGRACAQRCHADGIGILRCQTEHRAAGTS